MSNTKEEKFESIKTLASTQGIDATLDQLATQLRASGEFHQLFEVLKMKTRHELGLPLLYDQRPEIRESEKQTQLEEGLLEACREVGTELVKNGKLRDGWIYLQPLGDKELVQSLIEKFEVSDDNIDEIIDVSLLQQAAPAIGFSLVLERYGTCNAITSFDSSAHTFDAASKAELATLLVNHLHNELMNNLTSFLKDNDKEVNPSDRLIELVRKHKAMVSSAGPMTDATHLSSCMRIGRFVEESKTLQLLAEMAEYGCQLAEPFHFPGDAPFEKTYRDHLTYYRALTASDKDAPEINSAVQFFDQKSRDTAGDQYNPVCDEIYVELLYRLGRSQEAIDVSLERLSQRQELTGIAPPVYQIASEPSHYETLEKHYRSKSDLLGFTVSVLLQNEQEK